MAEPSTMTAVNGSDQFTINGYITRNGNLGVNGSGGLIINDTLVIVGNLSMTTSTGFTVGTNGLLIVLGDFFSSGGDNKINVQGNGRVAIVGNYQQTQGSVTTGNAFYIYDDTPEFTNGACNGGASVDGVNYGCPNNTATLTNFMEDEQDLHNNDVPLEEFLASLGVTCGFANLNTAVSADPLLGKYTRSVYGRSNFSWYLPMGVEYNLSNSRIFNGNGYKQCAELHISCAYANHLVPSESHALRMYKHFWQLR